MRKLVIWIIVVAAVAAGIFLWLRTHNWKPRSVVIQGAVIRSDKDPRKQQPIADALVTATDGVSTATAQSDASGYFKLVLGTGVWPQSLLRFTFQHADYKPLDLTMQLGLRPSTTKLLIAPLEPVTPETDQETNSVSTRPPSVISNIRVRYTVNTQADTNIGSVARTFQVDNQGNVPCNRQETCSPDGKWKAATGSITLDAGPGNVFRNARVTCIAGPCPFTHIDLSSFVDGSRSMTASALDWSDTATFLLEAEVFRDSIESNVRESYPVIFGRTLHFTLPPTQEGVSIEAELNGTPMVFLLGPDLYLSWATCTARSNVEGDKSTVYQCELKPDYRF